MAMKARYEVINGEVIAEKRSGVRRCLVPDPLGSTVALLDNTQSQTDTFAYWPYGEERTRTGTTATPFRYSGKVGCYRDNPTRSYLRSREFSSGTGRWLTVDVDRARNVLHSTYVYCFDSPITWFDRNGRFPIFFLPKGKPNCKPVVYNCGRNFGSNFWPFHHVFFWIHYPCDPSRDGSVSYGPPGGYPNPSRPVGPGEPDDMISIHNGTANCHRTNCDPSCVLTCGYSIRPGGPWDPCDFSLPPVNCGNISFTPGYPWPSMGSGRWQTCWSFNDFCRSYCDCGELPGFPEFTPNPRPLPVYGGPVGW